MRRHVSRYRAQLYDLNAFGELHSAGFLRFMQQTASDASAAAGFDVEWYARQGTIWLIRRTQLECLGVARHPDELAVHTWVSDMRRVRSQREYEFHREADGQVIARGSSDWVYVDLVRGKPVRIPDEVQHGLMPDGVTAQPREPMALHEPPLSASRATRRVEFAALDSVAHVNNAHYATYLEQDLLDGLATHGWVIDPLASDGCPRLRRLDIEYLEAALYRESLTGIVWTSAVSDDGFRCEYALERAGRRLLQASSEWQYRGTASDALVRAARALMEEPP